MTTFAGGGSAGGTTSGYADGFGTQAMFSVVGIGGITVDMFGQIFMSDSGNHAIRMISPQGLFV